MLFRSIVRALQRPEIKERLFNAGTEAVGTSAEEFVARIRAQVGTMSKLIRDAGLRAD